MATKKKNEVVAAEEEVEIVPEWLQKMRVGETVDYAGGVNFINSDVGSAGTMGSTTDGTTTEDGESEWEKYKEQYIADQTAMYTDYGKRAMQDTVGEISARTGGLASSYAGIAGQETYDNYMQELAAKYPDLVAAAMEMYNLEHPKAKSNNWTYGIASNDTTAKKEDAKKKATAKKGSGEEAEDEDYLSGGMTEEEIWALRGLNPDYVSKNRTAKEIETLYADSVYRATDPTYSSVIDPYYAAGTSTKYPWIKGTAADLPTMANYMSPESMEAYLAYLTEVERLKKAAKK
jgi:hypothetical protein